MTVHAYPAVKVSCVQRRIQSWMLMGLQEHLDGSKLVEDVLFSSNRLIRIKDDYDNLGVVRDISHLGNNDRAQNCFVICFNTGTCVFCTNDLRDSRTILVDVL